MTTLRKTLFLLLITYGALPAADADMHIRQLAQSNSAGEAWNRALAQLEKEAEAGNDKARYRLGRFYQKGQGVEQDDARALAYIQQAAASGYGRAQYRMGQFAERGYADLASNKQAARNWYRKAYESGSHKGWQALERLLEADAQRIRNSSEPWNERARLLGTVVHDLPFNARETYAQAQEYANSLLPTESGLVFNNRGKLNLTEGTLEKLEADEAERARVQLLFDAIASQEEGPVLTFGDYYTHLLRQRKQVAHLHDEDDLVRAIQLLQQARREVDASQCRELYDKAKDALGVGSVVLYTKYGVAFDTVADRITLVPALRTKPIDRAAASQEADRALNDEALDTVLGLRGLFAEAQQKAYRQKPPARQVLAHGVQAVATLLHRLHGVLGQAADRLADGDQSAKFYRQRMKSLDEDIAAATEDGDDEEVARLKEEKEKDSIRYKARTTDRDRRQGEAWRLGKELMTCISGVKKRNRTLAGGKWRFAEDDVLDSFENEGWLMSKAERDGVRAVCTAGGLKAFGVSYDLEAHDFTALPHTLDHNVVFAGTHTRMALEDAVAVSKQLNPYLATPGVAEVAQEWQACIAAQHKIAKTDPADVYPLKALLLFWYMAGQRFIPQLTAEETPAATKHQLLQALGAQLPTLIGAAYDGETRELYPVPVLLERVPAPGTPMYAAYRARVLKQWQAWQTHKVEVPAEEAVSVVPATEEVAEVELPSKEVASPSPTATVRSVSSEEMSESDGEELVKKSRWGITLRSTKKKEAKSEATSSRGMFAGLRHKFSGKRTTTKDSARARGATAKDKLKAALMYHEDAQKLEGTTKRREKARYIKYRQQALNYLTEAKNADVTDDEDRTAVDRASRLLRTTYKGGIESFQEDAKAAEATTTKENPLLSRGAEKAAASGIASDKPTSASAAMSGAGRVAGKRRLLARRGRSSK